MITTTWNLSEESRFSFAAIYSPKPKKPREPESAKPFAKVSSYWPRAMPATNS